jgi:hypothetical protein
MRIRTILSVLIALVALAGFALAADLSGKWNYQMPTRNGGTREASMTLKQDGSALTGSVTGMRGMEQPISDGKVDGNNVSFNVKVQFQDNSFVMHYKGVASDDEIKFTVEREGGEPREFTAKRAK